MSRFLKSSLQALAEYVPGEQPQDKKYVKLNTNESPYPPPQAVIDAVNAKELADLRLYCDPDCKLLRKKLADTYGVGSENVFLSNGSDDILNFAFMAYGQQGAAFADITYGFYSVFAQLYGIEPEIIPLEDDFSLDVRKYFQRHKLIVIANPNAPTGIALSLSQIEQILAENTDSVVVIDEAYVDFGTDSAVGLIGKHDNLLVVQTYSKSRSMAGARLGFAFGSKALIADLEKIKYSTNPYNINRLTQIAGAAALDREDYFKANCRKIMDTRAYVKAELEALGFTVCDSKANFLFAESTRISGEALYLTLKERGVLIRHFTKERICNFNRITIGSREEMEIFLRNTKDILEELA